MTLLSIREQEAVKEALKDVEDHLFYRSSLPEWRISYTAACRKYESTLILATRDAIARQVREQADAVFAKHQASCVASGMLQAATFIAELPL